MRVSTFGAFLTILLFLFQPVAAQPPAGYYETASGLSGEALGTALHNIIRGHYRQSYDNIWTHFYQTDRKPETNIIWDMYSDVPGGPQLVTFTYITHQCESTVSGQGICYNREHSFPVSWWGGSTSDTMYTDIVHIIPTDGWVNNFRSNHPYGEVTESNPDVTLNGSMRGTTTGFPGDVFEPIDAYKGDLARNVLYMLIRYKSRVAGWSSTCPIIETGGTLSPWAKDLLLQWHFQDPVSDKEIARNNAVNNIQGNRNPFIDHPEYVNQIWGSGLAEEPQYHVTDFSAHSITLEWADATGTYLPDAYLVRMSAESFEAIEAPVDGSPVSTDAWNQNVSYGKQKAVFGGLTTGQVYYFKIFSYKGSGSAIDYKTDGTVPQTSIQAN